MISVSSTMESRKRLEASFDKLEQAPRKLGEAVALEFARTISQQITDIFQREGPGWAPLAVGTVAERKRLGFSPRHPILRRTGSLLAALTEPGAPGHVLTVAQTGSASTTLYYGTRDVRYRPLRYGLPEHNLPARPMIPVDFPMQQAVLEKQMDELMAIYMEEAIK